MVFQKLVCLDQLNIFASWFERIRPKRFSVANIFLTVSIERVKNLSKNQMLIGFTIKFSQL